MASKKITRREFVKRSAALAGAAAVPAWLTPRRAWAAKPRINVWTIGFFNPKADASIRSLFQEFAGKAGVEVNHVVVPGPQITRKLQTAVEGGAPPDIAVLYDADTQYYRGINKLVKVADLFNEMKKEPEGIFSAAVNAVEYKGEAFGIPLACNPWPVHWRKDLLEKHKLDYPKDIFEFAETCKKVQKKPMLHGFGPCLGRALDGVDNIMNVCWLFDGWVTKDEKTLTLDSPGMIAGLKFLNKMFNEDKTIPKGTVNWDDGGNNKAYQSKQVAFISNPTSVYSYLMINDKDLAAKTGLAPFPAGPAGSFSLIDYWSFGVFNATKELNACKDAIKYIMQPERYASFVEQAGGRTVPIFRRLTKRKFWRDHPVFNEFIKMPDYAYPVCAKSPLTPAVSEVMNSYLIPDMAHEVLLRGVPAEEAAAKAQKRAQDIFDRHYS